MSSLRTRPLVSARVWVFAVVFGSAVAGLGTACSSSSSPSVVTDGGPSDDASVADAPIGPLFCDLPVPATCPMTAPCSFAAWACAEPSCDGYFVITDGTWTYYYSAVGGALAGEVPATDAGFVACPYAFQPPASCAPAIASQCSLDAGTPPDGGGPSDTGGARDASSAADGASFPDGAAASDGGGAGDGASGADGGASDSGTESDGS